MANAYFLIPRNSLVWLLTAHLGAVLPHLVRIPWWLSMVVAVCVVWRVMVFRGAWPYPNRLVRALLVIICALGIFFEYGAFFGVAPSVSFLIATYSLKLLEMHKQRDAFVVVILGYFVVGAEFLFEAGIPMTLYCTVIFAMITASLLGLNQLQSHRDFFRTGKSALLLLMQSAPIMLVLFVFFPRIAPLWSLDLADSRAKTGLSDQMTPADVAELGRSSELAFRVIFNGEPPAKEALYWRGMVLSYYDGRTWSQGRIRKPLEQLVQWDIGESEWDHIILRKGDPIEYEVIMEPTDKPWLFSLETPVPKTEGVGLTRDFRLVNNAPVSQLYRYEVMTFQKYQTALELESWVAEMALQLPEAGDERTRALAREMFEKGNGNAQAMIDQLLLWFNQDLFYYTLKPPKLGVNAIDEFLFDTKQGFCAHYSGAFVYMLRTVGIPARVVVGYQGGEMNPLGNHMLVYQYDAHAWAEVWMEDRGWVRFDPTGAVAPSRILQGVDQLMQDNAQLAETSLFSPLRLKRIQWLNQIRFSFDLLNHRWNRFVLNYDNELQMELFKKWFGSRDQYTMVLIMSGLIIGLLLLVAFVVIGLPKKGPYDKVDLRLLEILKRLEKVGYQREPKETFSQLVKRIDEQSKDSKPIKAVDLLEELAGLYGQLKYQQSLNQAKLEKQFCEKARIYCRLY